MEETTTRSRAPWRWPLHWQVLAGIVVGIGCGWLSGALGGAPAARVDMQGYSLVGDLFMSALKLLVVPLVATSIVAAIAGIGRESGFLRLGGKTLLYYLATSLVAILIGLTLVSLIRPGARSGIDAEGVSAAVRSEGSAEAAHLATIVERTSGRSAGDLLGVVKSIVPENIVVAAADPGKYMLGIIAFSLLVGFFISRLHGQQRELLTTFAEGAYQVMLGIAHFILALLPIGVIALIAKTTAQTVADGNVVERLGQLVAFALTVVAALVLHAFVVMPAILRVVARVRPVRHYQAVGPALLTAFSSASSSATLPLTMDCLIRRARVSKRVGSFVLPVGATVNMDGTALYECVAVLFLTQLYGIQLGFADQFVVVALALLTSIGVAGIPSASLVAIVIILNAINARLPAGTPQVPVDALAIILVFDRLLDMCRTAVNVLGDTVGAVVVARSEGEEDVLAFEPARIGRTETVEANA